MNDMQGWYRAIAEKSKSHRIPLKSDGGVFDMGFDGLINGRWLYQGNIYTQKRLQITVSKDDTVYLLADGFTDLSKITSNYMKQNLKCGLSDFQKLFKYYFSLDNCSLVTGSVSELPPATNTINLNTCSLVIGSLSELHPLTNVLGLTNCSLVNGAYTSVNGNNVPTTTILTGTGLSTTDMDNTLIAYAACTKSDGTFSATGKTRTAASDDAVANLTGRGWTIDGITKV